jgi:hypothetical protein
MYENAWLCPPAPTTPGIDIKVTPDRLLPIIPMATRYQGDLCRLIKKSSVVEPREVTQARKMRSKKYPATIDRMSRGDMPDVSMAGKIIKGEEHGA